MKKKSTNIQKYNFFVEISKQNIYEYKSMSRRTPLLDGFFKAAETD